MTRAARQRALWASRRALPLAALAAAALGPAGCSPPQFSSPARAVVDGPLYGPRAGVETRLWAAVDRSFAVGRALESLSAVPALEPADHERLSAAGLRLVRLDQEAVELFESLGIVQGARDRTWRGMMPRWTQLVRGPDRAESWVDLGGRSVPLGMGHVSVYGRAYPVPPADPGAEPGLWIELVARHTPRRGRALTLGATRVGWRAEAGVAYLLVAERAEVDWAALPEPAADDLEPSLPIVPEPGIESPPLLGPEAPADPETGPPIVSADETPERAVAEAGEFGPTGFADPSLGDWAMLSFQAARVEGEPPEPVRTILVIIPRPAPG